MLRQPELASLLRMLPNARVCFFVFSFLLMLIDKPLHSNCISVIAIYIAYVIEIPKREFWYKNKSGIFNFVHPAQVGLNIVHTCMFSLMS